MARVPTFADPTYTRDEILAKNNVPATHSQANVVRIHARRSWDAFYKNHQNRFFKERHWTEREFFDLPELGFQNSDTIKVLLEVGCGTGSFFTPLLSLYPHLRVHAFDFSANAIKEVLASADYSPSTVHAFVHDLTQDESALRQKLQEHQLQGVDQQDDSVHVVSCIFVLSALGPEKHAAAVQMLVNCLKPGGVLVLRDYALYDAAQLRFHCRPSANYSDPALLSADYPLYRRSDNTMSYFFTSEEMDGLMQNAGLQTIKTEVVEREMSNRKQEWSVGRRFVQGIWRKPA